MKPADSNIADRPRPPIGDVELSIVLPCLNEEKSLPYCMAKARQFIDRTDIQAEIIVADNGSEDASIKIAEAAGARVVHVQTRGYGAALQGGIAAAKGKYIIMGDSDDSYDFSQLDAYVESLRQGADLVMGNRFVGGIAPGAMPAMHRYFGNPMITFVGRCFFGGDCRDFYCGLRGFRKAAIEQLKLRSPGMEFALEMLVKATMYGMDVQEVPTRLSPDRRGRLPHLRRWSDGWRSLKFFLLFSPKWLFWYSGLAMLSLGLVGMALNSVDRFPSTHGWQLLSAGIIVIGYQTCLSAICGKQAALVSELHPPNENFQRWVNYCSLEKALVAGGGMAMAGLAGVFAAFWSDQDPASTATDPHWSILIPAVTLIIVGSQTVFGRFFLSLIQLCADWDRREPNETIAGSDS